MSDNLSMRGPADRTRVNVHESWELEYWTKHFTCTAAELRLAVSTAGVMVKDVQAYFLKKRGR